jgi:hypothetical protein
LKCDCPIFTKGYLLKKGELKAAPYGHNEGRKQPANESNTVKERCLLKAPGVVVAEGKGEVDVDVECENQPC